MNKASHLKSSQTIEDEGGFRLCGDLMSAMTAHPKTCPSTGELLFLGTYSAHLRFYIASPGEITKSEVIDIPQVS